MVMLALSTRPSCAATIHVVAPTVSVLVVDDLAWFRAATASVIDVSDGFIVAGEAASGEDAITILRGRLIDLVLMDVRMPGIGGIAAADQICRDFPDVAVVLLSVHDESDLPDRVPAGCQFCHKDQFGPDILEALWRQRGMQQ
jgi:two-component system invasion response regulator UvrY